MKNVNLLDKIIRGKERKRSLSMEELGRRLGSSAIAIDYAMSMSGVDASEPSVLEESVRTARLVREQYEFYNGYIANEMRARQWDDIYNP